MLIPKWIDPSLSSLVNNNGVGRTGYEDKIYIVIGQEALQLVLSCKYLKIIKKQVI